VWRTPERLAEVLAEAGVVARREASIVHLGGGQLLRRVTVVSSSSTTAAPAAHLRCRNLLGPVLAFVVARHPPLLRLLGLCRGRLASSALAHSHAAARARASLATPPPRRSLLPRPSRLPHPPQLQLGEAHRQGRIQHGQAAAEVQHQRDMLWPHVVHASGEAAHGRSRLGVIHQVRQHSRSAACRLACIATVRLRRGRAAARRDRDGVLAVAVSVYVLVVISSTSGGRGSQGGAVVRQAAAHKGGGGHSQAGAERDE
jgi:hypothetical protein